MYNRLVHSKTLSIRFHQQKVQQLHTHIHIITNIIYPSPSPIQLTFFILTEVTQKLSQKRTLLGLLLLDGVDSVRVLASKIIVAITIMKSHLNFGFLTRPHDT